MRDKTNINNGQYSIISIGVCPSMIFASVSGVDVCTRFLLMLFFSLMQPLCPSVGMSVGQTKHSFYFFMVFGRFLHCRSCPKARLAFFYPPLQILDLFYTPLQILDLTSYKTSFILYQGRECSFPLIFLVADTQLYKRLCPSVGRS